MTGESSRNSGKRDDDKFSKKPPAKRVRFPKGKKVKPGVEIVVDKEKENVEKDDSDLTNPVVAAKERAKRRSLITAELFSEDNRGISNDISAAEVTYEENENFVDDGIQIEPVNLNKERDEGYFDAARNFVEYVKDDEIKDAPQFLLCLLPERKNSDLYGPWKKKNLAEFGIVTQCIARSAKGK